MTKEEFIHGISQKDIVYLADGNILKLMPRGSNISLSNNNPSLSTAIQIQLKNVDGLTPPHS